MAKKFINRESITGRLYQHDLQIKQVQNQQSANYGKDFISGKLEIAVDEEGLNVIETHYTYVAPTYKNGNENKTFTALKNIIETGKTWVVDGKDAATFVQAQPNLDLNDFYNQQGELISAKRNEGGFVSIVSSLPEDVKKRATFDVDLLITNVKEVEANEENGTPASVTLHGAIFDWQGAIKPLELTVLSQGGIDYFLSQDVSTSTPMFTEVRGVIDCTVRVEKQTLESAFGEPAVREVRRGRKQWVVNWAAPVPYDFGDESVLTADEVTSKIQDRNVKLAEDKKRHEDYVAQKNALPFSESTAATSAPTPVQNAAFNF